MRPESAKYLRDMQDAARSIQDYARGRTEEEYLADRAFRDAVQWNFCVIGEALTQLGRADPETAHRITDHRRIVGLRNQLLHGYSVINSGITWNIIQEKLPILVRELELLLSDPIE
jgi:uncharacterized protein with HEPN domain